jgi:hypothetical protein
MPLHPLFFYQPMQEDTPKLVANAVNTVMANCNTFCQNSFFIMVQVFNG